MAVKVEAEGSKVLLLVDVSELTVCRTVRLPDGESSSVVKSEAPTRSAASFHPEASRQR